MSKTSNAPTTGEAVEKRMWFHVSPDMVLKFKVKLAKESKEKGEKISQQDKLLELFSGYCRS